MKLSPRSQFALLGLSLAALIAVVFWQGPEPASPGTPSRQPMLTSAPAAPPPSSENVDPTFHARLIALEKEAAAAPTDTAALLALARFQQDAHQLGAAAESYERLLAAAPDHRQAYLDLALVYAEEGRPDEARRVTRALLDRLPNDPAARYNLGALAANDGDYEAARAQWQAVAAGADAGLAEQARASLAQLDALAARPAPSPSSAQRTALPSGHPPLPTLQPILAD